MGISDNWGEYLALVQVYPHCDALVLHVKGSCDVCDLSEMEPLHEYRRFHAINYTGQSDPDKQKCPVEKRRDKTIIDRWPGNTAKRF